MPGLKIVADELDRLLDVPSIYDEARPQNGAHVLRDDVQIEATDEPPSP